MKEYFVTPDTLKNMSNKIKFNEVAEEVVKWCLWP